MAEPQTYAEFVAISAAGGTVAAAGFAAVNESALGDFLYARAGEGLLNGNNYIRLGYGWDQTIGPAGAAVFRLAIGSKALGRVIHWSLWIR